MPSLSYVHGKEGPALTGETIGAVFARVAHEHADRLALISSHQDIRWTYSELQRRVDAAASGLLGLGLRPGDRVGIWSPNCAEWTIVQFATAKAGLILVNVNPAYRTAELEYALKTVRCKALVTSVEYKTSAYLDMLRDLLPELREADANHLQSARLPDLQMVVTLGEGEHRGCLRLDDVIILGERATALKFQSVYDAVQMDDPVNIQFTSGTTGRPKGATLSHHNILNNGFFVGEAAGIVPGDKVCIPVPMYHCFGMVMGNLGCITHGATMVYPSPTFNAVAVLETVERERCSALYGVPTMFISVLNHPEFRRFDLGSLSKGIMAGSPCPIEIMKRVVAELHMRDVTIAYGMTETSPVSFQSVPEDSVERRVSTVGRILPHLEAKVVDRDGCVTPVGIPGELCTRGYSVMLGYWDDPARTADVLDPAGWMHTGDLATIDEAGFCNIVGRIKDLVIRGGENLYPGEIEEFLYQHPSIRDVQIVGVPDVVYGEELCAWIIAQSGEQLSEANVRSFCAGQIAHHKIPRYVYFVDEFPTTVTGKVQKYVMREWAKDRLALAAPAVG